MGLAQGFKGLIVPNGIILNVSTASVGNGATYQLIPYITPLGVKNNKVYYASSDITKATVDNNGLVTGTGNGSVTITATTDYGSYTSSCIFTVYTINVTGISLNETEISLTAGDTYQLEAIITPSNATNKNVTRRSTDTSIATVDSNGLVTSITDGECQIIATTVDGNYTASCDVVSGYVINENTLSYFPFEEDFIDKKGNRTLTVNDCTISDGSCKINSKSSYMTLSSGVGGSQMTISVWYYYGGNSTDGGRNTLFARTGGTYHHFLFPAKTDNGIVGAVGFYNSAKYLSNVVLKLNNWYNIVIVKSGTNEKIYINSELAYESNSSFDNNSWPVGTIANYNSGQSQGAQGKMSDLIFEQGTWDQTKINKYFNNTKKRYFLTINDYDELEYIQSTGTQYIDSMFIDTANTEIEIDMEFSGLTTQQRLFGHGMDSDYGGYSYEAYINGGTQWARANQDGIGQWQSTNIAADTNRHTFILNNSNYKIYTNGTLVHEGANTATITRTNSHTMVFLARKFITSSSAFTIQQFASGKFYSAKMSDNGVLVRDFMPCKRKSDGVIGVRDKVKKVFYFNPGSGTFTAGPKIGVSLNINSISLSAAGQTYQLTATTNPASIAEGGFTRTSSDTSIATVNSTGLVTCVTPGDCTITVKTNNIGYTDTCNVVAKQEYIYNFDDGTWTNQMLSDEGWVNGGYGLNASSSGLVFADTSTDRGGSRRKEFTVSDNWNTLIFYFKGVKNGAWGGVYGTIGTVSGTTYTGLISIQSNYNNSKNGLIIGGTWVRNLSYNASVEGTITYNRTTGAWTSTINGSTTSGTNLVTFTDNLFMSVDLSKGYYSTPSCIYKIKAIFE